MTREALTSFTINDNDQGSLPVCGAGVTRTFLSSGAQTVSGATSAQTLAQFIELILFFNITAMSGSASPTIQFFIDSSPDGGVTWATIASLDPISAVPSSMYTLGVGRGVGNGPLNSNAFGYPVSWGTNVRVRWIITGTTPSWTFSIVAGAK